MKKFKQLAAEWEEANGPVRKGTYEVGFLYPDKSQGEIRFTIGKGEGKQELYRLWISFYDRNGLDENSVVYIR